MKTRPLFGICPLFGVSVKREFTVYIMQNKDYVVINNFAAFIYRSLLLVN